MCCLNYEYGFYEKIKRDLPKIGKKVTTKNGDGKVVRQNVLKESLTVMLDSGTEVEVKIQDLVQEGFFMKKPKRSRKEKGSGRTEKRKKR
jgi:cell fate regulator YaaT (PSP1 superfamily)